MTAAEFEQEVSNWLATNKQSKFNRLYTELIYQPQLELLNYLRANGFKRLYPGFPTMNCCEVMVS
jgi:hypothetical protein